MSKKINLINFYDLTLEEKKMILSWRNNPSIKKWMYNSDEITLQNHLNFIDSLKNEKNKLYFLIKKDEEYIGVIDFTKIQNDSCEFGVYANPELKGMGKYLMNAITTYAFSTLNVKVLKAEVFQENEKAINFYLKYNFKKTDIKIEHKHNVICMELNYEDR